MKIFRPVVINIVSRINPKFRTHGLSNNMPEIKYQDEVLEKLINKEENSDTIEELMNFKNWTELLVRTTIKWQDVDGMNEYVDDDIEDLKWHKYIGPKTYIRFVTGDCIIAYDSFDNLHAKWFNWMSEVESLAKEFSNNQNFRSSGGSGNNRTNFPFIYTVKR